jgi:hypothetical protein
MMEEPFFMEDQFRSSSFQKVQPSATAILDRFLHHAEIIAITGRSYRLRNQARGESGADDSSPPLDAKPAIPPAGSAVTGKRKKATSAALETCQSQRFQR